VHELTYPECLAAVLENAFDQVREGPCRSIQLEILGESFRVRDDGEGLPVHPHPFSKRPLLEVILMGPRRGEPNTLARVTKCCLWVEVETETAGARYRQRYEFARPADELAKLGDTPGRGVALTMAPAEGAAPGFAELLDTVRELGRGLGPRVQVEVRDARSGEQEVLELGGLAY